MKAAMFPIDGPWKGHLAILPRPRGGDWLEGEIAGWKKAGLDVVVSALTPDEAESLDLNEEAAEAERIGLALVSLPIPDRGIPESVSASNRVIRQLWAKLNEGKSVGIHCRQGIGRSAMLAAALLIISGISPGEAWRRLEVARGCPVPETAEQRAWSDRLAQFALADKPV